MEFCRIIYKPEGSVSIALPNIKKVTYQSAIVDGEPQYSTRMETEVEALDRLVSGIDELKDLPYEDIDKATLPPDRVHRDKWRKKVGGQGVEIDHTVITPAERRKDDEALLSVELKKTSPSSKVALNLMNKLRKGNY